MKSESLFGIPFKMMYNMSMLRNRFSNDLFESIISIKELLTESVRSNHETTPERSITYYSECFRWHD